MKASILALLSIVLLLPGCALDKAKSQRIGAQLGSEAVSILGRVAFQTLLNTAQQEINGGNVDLAYAASAALLSESERIINSGSITRIIAAASDNSLPATGAAAAKTVRQAEAQGVPKEVAITAVANTISSVALQK